MAPSRLRPPLPVASLASPKASWARRRAGGLPHTHCGGGESRAPARSLIDTTSSNRSRDALVPRSERGSWRKLHACPRQATAGRKPRRAAARRHVQYFARVRPQQGPAWISDAAPLQTAEHSTNDAQCHDGSTAREESWKQRKQWRKAKAKNKIQEATDLIERLISA